MHEYIYIYISIYICVCIYKYQNIQIFIPDMIQDEEDASYNDPDIVLGGGGGRRGEGEGSSLPQGTSDKKGMKNKQQIVPLGTMPGMENTRSNVTYSCEGPVLVSSFVVLLKSKVVSSGTSFLIWGGYD